MQKANEEYVIMDFLNLERYMFLTIAVKLLFSIGIEKAV
jgi:hypothetical protein